MMKDEKGAAIVATWTVIGWLAGGGAIYGAWLLWGYVVFCVVGSIFLLGLFWMLCFVAALGPVVPRAPELPRRFGRTDIPKTGAKP